MLYSHVDQEIWTWELPVVPLTQLLYAIYFLFFQVKVLSVLSAAILIIVWFSIAK